ncbi:MAG: hypothetical protein QNI89_04685 [Desulfobacterales bacterium]|nr:hypothetical protein [Desulfobacterales bacterium]
MQKKQKGANALIGHAFRLRSRFEVIDPAFKLGFGQACRFEFIQHHFFQSGGNGFDLTGKDPVVNPLRVMPAVKLPVKAGLGSVSIEIQPQPDHAAKKAAVHLSGLLFGRRFSEKLQVVSGRNRPNPAMHEIVDHQIG